MRPEIFSAITDEEADALRELARGQRVLELGAQYGFSTVVLAQAADYVVSVDWHRGDEHAGAEDTWKTYCDNLARYDVASKVAAMCGRFEDVLPELATAGEQFDGCFIDGQHDSASVQRDLGLALPLVKPGGWIAFHDYGRSAATGHPGFGITEVADRFGVDGVAGALAWGFR